MTSIIVANINTTNVSLRFTLVLIELPSNAANQPRRFLASAGFVWLCAGHARRLKSDSMDYNDTYFKLESRASPNGGEG